MADAREQWMLRLGLLYPGMVAMRQTTAVRWPVELQATADDSARAAPWMVVVGAVIGVGAWLCAWLVGHLGLTVALRGTVAIAALALLSAALLDVGLARTVDRALGRDTSDHALGAGGAVALTTVALIRVVALLSTRPSMWLAALVVAPLLGRWSALLLQRLGDVLDPPASDRRSLIVGEVSWAWVGGVTGLCALIAVLALGVRSLIVMLVAGAIAFAIGLASEKRRGGLDADALAAVAAVCELVALVGAAAIAPALASPWT